MKEKVSKKFQEIYGSGAILFASPGRINLIGEHTDYNGSKLKTLRKKVAAAVETSDKEAAAAAYNTFSSAVDKAAKVGIIPANRAANYKSKAAKAIAKIA